MNQEAQPEPVVSLEKVKPLKKSFVPTPAFGHAHPSDIHEEPVDFDDLPEQAQLDYEHRHSCTTRLELWITDLVARHQTSIWWLTICTCVIPLSIFFAIDAPFLYANVSPVPPLIVAVLFGLCAILFLSTSFMDPGTVKPYSVEMNMALEADLRAEQNADYEKPCYVVASGTIRPQWSVKRQYSWVVNGQEVLTDWCYHCNVYKPPRVHHCKLCGRCIERFDHHCPWLDNCVGIRNYRWFILLLILYGLMWIILPVSSVIHIVLRTLTILTRGIMSEAEWSELLYVISTILMIVAAAGNLHFLFVLLMCQHDLLKLGLTVHEFKTDKYFNRTLHKFRSPFDRGSLWKNILDACWNPWRPKRIGPKSPVHDLATLCSLPNTPASPPAILPQHQQALGPPPVKTPSQQQGTPQAVNQTKSTRTVKPQPATSSHHSHKLQPVSSNKSHMSSRISPKRPSPKQPSPKRPSPAASGHSGGPVLSTNVLPALGFSEAERRATEPEVQIKQSTSRPVSRGSGHFTIEVSPAPPTEV